MLLFKNSISYKEIQNLLLGIVIHPQNIHLLGQAENHKPLVTCLVCIEMILENGRLFLVKEKKSLCKVCVRQLGKYN